MYAMTHTDLRIAAPSIFATAPWRGFPATIA